MARQPEGAHAVAPQPIEQLIKRSRFVNQVVVVGNGRKFPAALIVPDWELLESYAKLKGLDLHTRADFCRHPRIIDLFERQIAARTQGLAQFEKIKRIALLDHALGTRETVPAEMLFALIGAQPHTEWLAGTVLRDRQGFIITGRRAREGAAGRTGREPARFETSMPGVFAVGDVRSGSVKRLASAVGEGAASVQEIHEYLSSSIERVSDLPSKDRIGRAEPETPLRADSFDDGSPDLRRDGVHEPEAGRCKER